MTWKASKRTSKTAYLIHRSGKILLKTDYVDDFVPRMKEVFGYSQRKWDQNLGVWIFDGSLEGELKDLVKDHFDYLVESWSDAPREEKESSGGTLLGKLHLTEDAPMEVVEAAYKALARIHHPDRGGAVARMAEINDAYDKIAKRRR